MEGRGSSTRRVAVRLRRTMAAGGLWCALLVAVAAHGQPTPYDEDLPQQEAEPEQPPPEQPPAAEPTPPPEPPAEQDEAAEPPEDSKPTGEEIIRDDPFGEPQPPGQPDDPKVEEAKQLWRQGLELVEAGDIERALAFFRRSRAAHPSAANITNMAVCLQQLGRYDESLEAYETLLTQHAGGLSPENRAAIAPTMKELRGKVASLWVSANVSGTVVVDGRERGKLPLDHPLRVLPGPRTVRILHPGHEPYETTIEPRARETVKLDAKLKPLANVGIVRVEAPPAAAATVVIDGAPAGRAPWEGPLAPGTHVVQLIAGEQGSALTKVIVNQGQIGLTRPLLLPLGPEVQIRTQPRSAALEIDGLAVGAGTWTGRLVVGAHTFSASESGYHDQKRVFESQVGDPVASFTLALPIDQEHPRWPQPPTASGDFWIGVYGGYAGTPTLGGDAAAACPEACDGSVAAHGGMFGLRAGYRFPMGLSLELGGGYLVLSSSYGRELPATFGATDEHAVSYRIDDSLLVRGPYLSPGVSYRLPLAEWLSLEGRAELGVLFAAASDDYDASIHADGTSSEATVANRAVARTVTIFIAPELGAVADLGAIELKLSLALPIFPLEGPTLDNGPLGPSAGRDPSNPGAAANAPVSTVTEGETAWDAFVTFSPQLAAEYAF